MDRKWFDNSFYKSEFHGRVLVAVPHEDDEINVAGNLIASMTGSGAEVFVLYTTNGDWKTPAGVRAEEAEASLRVLGVPRDHILFLGYGDSLNNDRKDSLFYHPEGSVTSPAGHKETYAADGFSDFAYQFRKRHSIYNSSNYLSDLTDAIRMVHADLIVCVDLDEHADHRMLSLYFDRAMNAIFREDPEYSPQILKRFAYALAYTAKADLFQINNPSTVRPEVNTTGKYRYDLVDTSLYGWNSRLRLPAARGAVSRSLKSNLLAKALRCHKSQLAVSKADRIINGDEVYWERKTGNIALEAMVKATSGNPAYVTDGLLLHVRDIDSRIPVFEDYCWIPASDDPRPELTFSWKESRQISEIRIYGMRNENGAPQDLQVWMNDSEQKYGLTVSERGTPGILSFDPPVSADTCHVQTVQASGTETGIAEIEILSAAGQTQVIPPFIKLLIGDDFIYQYLADDKQREIDFGLYGYPAPVSEADVSLTIAGTSYTEQDVCLQGMRLFLPGKPGYVRVRAELVSDARVFDEVTVRTVSKRSLLQLQGRLALERRQLQLTGARRKLTVWKHYLEEHGFRYAAERLLEKIQGKINGKS